MPIADTIEDAKKVYALAGLNCGEGLLPHIDERAIDDITATLSLPVPNELRDIYRIHGGQAYIPPGTTGLFGLHRLLTPSELVQEQLMVSEEYELNPVPQPAGKWPYWDHRLLPFGSWDAYLLCVHAESGEVWEFRPYDGLRRHWQNIESILHEVIAAVREWKPPQPAWNDAAP